MCLFRTDFEFYYDEDTMDLPEAVLDSAMLSAEAKNVYVYIIYLITEGVDHIVSAMRTIPEVSDHVNQGMQELLACGLLRRDETASQEAYIVTKEFYQH